MERICQENTVDFPKSTIVEEDWFFIKVHHLHSPKESLRGISIRTRSLHMFKRQIIILFSILWVHSLSAETLRLNSGETLKGRIRAMDEQILYLDSELTSQQLKVERSDIRLIEFDEVLRSMTRRLGLGLFYRPNGSVEEISVKNWLSQTDALELLVSYREGTSNLFSVEARFNRVFLQEGEYDLYYGAGGGLTTVGTEKGTRLRVFSGSEMFPTTSPNVGIGVEIGLIRESAGPSTKFDASNKTLNEQTFYHAFTARYYF